MPLPQEPIRKPPAPISHREIPRIGFTFQSQSVTLPRCWGWEGGGPRSRRRIIQTRPFFLPSRSRHPHAPEFSRVFLDLTSIPSASPPLPPPSLFLLANPNFFKILRCFRARTKCTCRDVWKGGRLGVFRHCRACHTVRRS